MRRFLIILPLITFTTITLTPDSVFAASCPAGYYGTGARIAAPSSSGNSYGYYDFNGDKSNYTSPALSAGQWSATWNRIGVAKGIASCNDTSGGGVQGSTSGSSDSFTNSTNGVYCWCRMTEWTPRGGAPQSLAGAWVYLFDYTWAMYYCADNCASGCGDYVYDDSDFRSAVFRAVGVCTACPDGGTSSAGATEITQCYIPTTTTFTDSIGTYNYSENCYYSE